MRHISLLELFGGKPHLRWCKLQKIRRLRDVDKTIVLVNGSRWLIGCIYDFA